MKVKVTLTMPGSTRKTCPCCGATIGVASKTCKVCGEPQPYKALKRERLAKARERVEQSPQGRRANAVKLRDAAHVHIVKPHHGSTLLSTP
ncbi:hypothetical protein NFI96_027436 [Prochilodus magdalenae]|nr:hypothetical protein NFI96_027436 [Prochilodus magdalenae]